MESQRKKILLVEDDVFVRDIYHQKLLKEDFDVEVAENGIMAMEKLEAGIPDLILLDCIMPYMSGNEVLKKIKANEKMKDVPIIMLTNISEKEKVDEGLRLGINDYLIKSHFTPSEVVEKIHALLKK